MEKLPPIEKVYEAYSAIADGRVELFEDEPVAVVTSSDWTKEYEITWSDGIYRSNDKASYWQGYAGYPVIAVLMMDGLLPLDEGICHRFADIDWNELNSKAKRDYARAAQRAFDRNDFDAQERKRAAKSAQAVIDALEQLDIQVKRNSTPIAKLD